MCERPVGYRESRKIECSICVTRFHPALYRTARRILAALRRDHCCTKCSHIASNVLQVSNIVARQEPKHDQGDPAPNVFSHYEAAPHLRMDYACGLDCDDSGRWHPLIRMHAYR